MEDDTSSEETFREEEEDIDYECCNPTGIYVGLDAPTGATNGNRHSTDDTVGHGALNDKDYCLLSRPNYSAEDPIDESTRTKGPKKWNDIIRRHLVKKGRKKAQTDENRKTIGDVISGSFQRFFGRSSYCDEKEKNPQIVNVTESNSITDDQLQSDSQLILAEVDDQDDEEMDSDELMWSENEFDEEDVYANIEDIDEEDDKRKNETDGRGTNPNQITSHSTQASTNATQVELTRMVRPTPLSPITTEFDRCKTYSSQSLNESSLAEDSQPNCELIDVKDYMISEDKLNDNKRSENCDSIVENFDGKSQYVNSSQSNENGVVISNSRDDNKTKLSVSKMKQTTNVIFNVPLRSVNKAEDDNATGINSPSRTRNSARSVLANGKPTDHNWMNRLEKQEQRASVRPLCGLSSETIHQKLIPTKPIYSFVAKPGNTAAINSSSTSPKMPNAMKDKTQSVECAAKPKVTSVRNPNVTSATESSAVSNYASVINTTKPSDNCTTKQDSTYVITKPTIVYSTIHATVPIHVKTGATSATTNPNISHSTPPSFTRPTKPSVTSTTPKPSVTSAATKSSVTSTTPKPSVTSAATKSSVTSTTPKSCVTSTTPKPSVTSTATKPSVTSTATKPSVTSTTTKPSVISTATKPNVTSTTTKPSITSTTTKPSVAVLTKPRVSVLTTPSANVLSSPNVTCSTTKLSDTCFATKASIAGASIKHDSTSIAKSIVVDCADKSKTFKTKEQAATLDVKKADFHERKLEELERISHQTTDATDTLGQSKTNTSRTQSPNIFKMISLFENNKHQEKPSSYIGSDAKSTRLQNSGGQEDSSVVRPVVLKKSKPMSDQQSFFSEEETSAPPPLPARKWSGSSSGACGGTLPAKSGMGMQKKEMASDDVPPAVNSSRRLPHGTENNPPTNFYLKSIVPTPPPLVVRNVEVDDDDDDDDVTVAYEDEIEFLQSIAATATAAATASVRAKSQPLPPIPSYPPPKPKKQVHSSGTQGRSSEPTIPSVPIPPVPARKVSGASTGNQGVAVDFNSNELEDVRRNLGKKPVRNLSESDEPVTSAPHPKVPLPPVPRTSASERYKDSTPLSNISSEDNTMKVTDEVTSPLEKQSWYHGDLSRTECETLIRSEGQNGGFIVRRRSDDVDGFPFVLSVLHNNRLNNIRIRRRPDKTFALGNEKANEIIFNDIMEMVAFHRNTPIILSNNVKVKLTSSPPRRRPLVSVRRLDNPPCPAE